MRKIFFLLLFSVMLNLNAQSCFCKDDYDEWSIEFNVGVNKPFKTMTVGYFTTNPSLYHIDLGARYTFNPYIGIKADIGYDSFKNKDNSADFNSNYLRLDIQAVTDVGYGLGIYDSKSPISVLFHAGAGLSQLNINDSNNKDSMINLIFGFTGTLKISKKISLSGDLSSLMHAKQSLNFDGNGSTDSNALKTNLLTSSVGIIYYLRR